ncbi:CBS and ACT domain-containing protein [Syntrophobacter fumaroxidans]|uniref:CBS domain containing membrane protein n=1 Tax=Syntrophobacter fumaroxidans (strain DSM 10017 / MPOB) TaxID=335543 RepID=A0LF08_SYNFM|nr:CBS and ACT domain-containing protein [Syntrophobacter fumaroxidans]ABK16010.1 CBS domain containing membrane protein [Syntrophobacter fumaroxidans MPOB]
MLVKNWMSKTVVTIEEDDSMQHAMSLMKEHKIRMLPVVARGKLVGVVSDTDLKRASASDATTLDMHELLYLISKIKVQDIMTKTPITVSQNFTVEETAELLMRKKISGCPVLDDDGLVVGVITRDDLFKVLIMLSGLGKKGIQLAFQVEDRSGSIKNITDVIRKYDGRIASILSSYEYAAPGHRIVYIRTYDIDRAVLPKLVEELKQVAMLIYIVDHRDNKREIFHDLVA